MLLGISVFTSAQQVVRKTRLPSVRDTKLAIAIEAMVDSVDVDGSSGLSVETAITEIEGKGVVGSINRARIHRSRQCFIRRRRGSVRSSILSSFRVPDYQNISS